MIIEVQIYESKKLVIIINISTLNLNIARQIINETY